MTKGCQNGDDLSERACNGVSCKDKSDCEDMDITYANGYQNGCGDEMGKERKHG